MRTAETGDTVRIHYECRYADGTVFGSSAGKDPVEFKLGEGQVIPGIEDAVEGLGVGEKTTARVPPERGYGQRRDELVLAVARTEFPDTSAPALGDQFRLRGKDGQPVLVTVRRLLDDRVEVDANHPLAGHELRFDVELVAIA